MSLAQDITKAVGSPPSEEAVLAGLRVVDEQIAEIRRLHATVAALTFALACRSEQIDSLKASNAALRLASEPNAAKAALIDHALEFEGSSLALVRMRLTRPGQWATDPVVDLAHARQVMDADLAASDDSETLCVVCNGSGEGQYDGSRCAACGGRGNA